MQQFYRALRRKHTSDCKLGNLRAKRFGKQRSKETFSGQGGVERLSRLVVLLRSDDCVSLGDLALVRRFVAVVPVRQVQVANLFRGDHLHVEVLITSEGICNNTEVR